MSPWCPQTAVFVARRVKLRKAGAMLIRQRGSHQVWEAPGGCRTFVAVHPGDVPTGTLRAIEKHMAACLGEGWLR